MGKRLVGAFAAEDPARFAQILGKSTDLAESISILKEVPDGLESDIVARLSPEAADRLLHELPDQVVIEWLGACPMDAGRRMLSRVGRERAARLVAGIGNRARRRELRRLIAYPPGSIGELLEVNVMAVPADAPAADIHAEIRRFDGSSEAPVVIVDDAGTVTGVLDLVRFMQHGDAGGRAADFRIPVKPLFADALLESFREQREWLRLTSLPVADFEGRLIGYVPRSVLEPAIRSTDEGRLFIETGVQVSKRFFEFMAYMLVLILDRRPDR